MIASALGTLLQLARRGVAAVLLPRAASIHVAHYADSGAPRYSEFASAPDYVPEEWSK